MTPGNNAPSTRLLQLAAIASLAVHTVLASPAAATWVRHYGPFGAGRAIGVSALPDGGAIVLTDGFERAVLRVDGAGEVVAARQLKWQASFVTTGPGGEIFVGSWLNDRDIDPDDRSMWVARLESDLTVRWARWLTVTDGTPRPRLLGAAGTRDGGLLLSGSQLGASYVLKLGADGAVDWKTTIDPSDDDEIRAVRETRDGDVVCAGRSRGAPWLLKLNRAGRVLWRRSYPAEGGFHDVIETSDGDVLAAGDGAGRGLLIRTAENGAPRWARQVQGTITARELAALRGGHLALLGLAASGHVVVVELLPDGNFGWSRRIDGGPDGTVYLGERGSLATTGDTLLYVPKICGGARPFDGDTYLMAIDAGDTAPAAMLAEAPALSLADVPWPAEELSFDAAEMRLDATTATPPLSPLSIASRRIAPGPANTPRPLPPPAEPGAAAAFRGRLEEEERAANYRRLLADEQYDRLDALVTTFRREQTRQDPMRWEIGQFYDALALDETLQEAERLARLRAWAEARPSATAARIALAEALYAAAWKRRGGGFNSTVTSTGLAEYAQRLAEAARVLDELGRKAEDDSHYWILRINLTQRSGGDVRALARAAADGGHRDPSVFRQAATYLHGKWGGSGAAYRAFAEEAANLTRSTFGEGMYAWLAYQAMVNVSAEELETEYAFDWQRMKRGFEDVIALAPDWPPSYHRYALVASRFGDRDTARRLFQRAELAWYPRAELMWRDRARYDTARDWALRANVEPFTGLPTDQASGTRPDPVGSGPAPQPPAPPSAAPPPQPSPSLPAPRTGSEGHWPPMLLQGELVSGTRSQPVVGFAVRGPRGVVVASAVPHDPERSDLDNALRDAWNRMTTWSMWLPSDATHRMAVTALATGRSPNPQLATALVLSPRLPAKAPLHVLTPSRLAATPSDVRKIYLVGCRWEGAHCRQIVAEGHVVGSEEGSTYRSFQVGLRGSFDADSFLGAPILDEDGHVLGVAGGAAQAWMEGYSVVLHSDYLSSVLGAGGR